MFWVSTVLAIGLAGCGQPSTSGQDDATSAASETTASNGGERSQDEAAKTANGAGVITAVDPIAGTLTLDHEPIPAVGWPAMTMSFRASPAVIGEATVGDRVQFDLTVRGTTGEVTAIYPH
ncbi:copper-binding protein [Brevundimonas aurifodinae]|uniref:Copper-binding protein n=1 Tax=Brevundimonas aurifodinae TaxID=1508312 RepID=A0ABV1NMH4_9CAUL